ncbi:MAG: hypothetical protein Q9163_006051 [Psora crenata]
MILGTVLRYLIGGWTLHIAVVEYQRYSNGLDLYDPSSIQSGLFSILVPSLIEAPQTFVKNAHESSSADLNTLLEPHNQTIFTNSSPISNATSHNSPPNADQPQGNADQIHEAKANQKLHAKPSPPKFIQILAAILAFFDELSIKSFFLGTGVSAGVAAIIWHEQRDRLSALDRALFTARQKLENAQTAHDSAVESAKQEATDAIHGANSKLQELEESHALTQKAAETANRMLLELQKLKTSWQEAADSTIAKLNAEVQTTRQGKDSAIGRTRDLERELQVRNDSVEDAKVSVEELETKLQTSEVSLNAAKARVEALEIAAQTNDNSLVASNTRVGDLDAELQTSNDSLAAAKARIDELEQSFRERALEVTTSSARVKELEVSLGERTSESEASSAKVKDLEREHSKDQSTITTLQSQLDESRMETHESRAKADEYSDILARTRLNFTSQNTRVKGAESAAKKAEERAGKLKNDVIRLNQKHATASTDLESLKLALQKSDRDLLSTRKALEEERTLVVTLKEGQAHKGDVHERALKDQVRCHEEVTKELEERLDTTVRCTECKKMRGLEKKLEEWEIDQQASEGKESEISPPTTASPTTPCPLKPLDSARRPGTLAPSPPPQPSEPVSAPQSSTTSPSHHLRAAATPFVPSPQHTCAAQSTEQAPVNQTQTHASPLQGHELAEATAVPIEPHHQAYRLPHKGADASGVKNTMTSLDDERDPKLFTKDELLKEIIRKREEEKKIEAAAQPRIDINSILSPPVEVAAQSLPSGPMLGTPPYHGQPEPAPQTLSPQVLAPPRVNAYNLPPRNHTPPLPRHTSSSPPATAGHQASPIPDPAPHHPPAGPLPSAQDSFQRQFGHQNQRGPVPRGGVTSRQPRGAERNQATAAQATKGAWERMQQMLGK